MSQTSVEKILQHSIENLPDHVAIIMDGNNRWAKKHNMGGITGHKIGFESVRAVIETAIHYHIKALTLFAFSSENWKRPEGEIKALMELFVFVLKKEVNILHDNNIRLRIIGKRSTFSSELQQLMYRAEQLTANNDGLQLTIAANYGGQWDIVQAARQLVLAVQSGNLTVDEIDEKQIQQRLCLSDLPVPDLLIRTSGEKRISNFLLWQLAYAELVFSSLYWPDFRHQAFVNALFDYSKRQRRFGQTVDQVGK